MIKFQKLSKTYKYCISIFLLVFLISFLTPITGDDWGNYLVGRKGFIVIWNSAVSMYRNWEGRFVSRLCLYFFTYHKWLWNLLNATMISLFFYCTFKMTNEKEKKLLYLIPICVFLLVNTYFSSQCYLWLAGNMTYLLPSILIVLVIYMFYQKQDKKFQTIEICLLCLLSFLIPMFVENIGCAYVTLVFLLILYMYYIKKKVPKFMFLMLVLSIVSLIIMLMSPGSAARMSMNSNFTKMNFSLKIFYNIPRFIRYTFAANIFILGFMMYPVNKWIYMKISSKKNKILILGLWNVIPVLTILQNIQYMIPANLSAIITFYEHGRFVVTNWYFIFYWAIFGIVYLLSIFTFIKDQKEALFYFIIMLSGIVSIGVMLLTPTWGERVSALFVLVLIITTTKMISGMNLNMERYLKPVKVVLGICMISYLSCSLLGKVFDIRRVNDIQKAKHSGQKELVLPVNLVTSLWNYEPWVELHLQSFKAYYGIEDIEVKLDVTGKKDWVRYILFGKIKEEGKK